MKRKIITAAICLGFLGFGLSSAFASQKLINKSLNSVVSHTLKTNPTITKEQLLSKISRYNLKQSIGNFLPSVDVSGNVGREHNESPVEQTVLDLDNGVTTSPKEVMVNLVQPVFTGFYNIYQYKQRRFEVKSQLYTLLDVKQSLALETIESYLNVIYGYRLVELAQKNVVTHEKNYQNAKALVEGKAGRQADLDLAIARLAVARAALQVAKINLENDKALFTELSGLQPIGLMMPSSVVNKLPASQKLLLNKVLAQNYELKEAFENSSAAHAAVPVAKSSFYPHLDIVLNHTTGENVNGIPGETQSNSALLTLSMNVFNGGVDYNEVRKAEAESAISISDIANVHRNIIQEATSLWQDLNYSEIQQQQLEKYVSASKAVVAGYQQQFIIGKRSLLNLLDVENELFNARKQLLINELHIKVVRYQLLSLMGCLLHTMC